MLYYALDISEQSQRNGAKQLSCMKTGSNILPLTDPSLPKVMISSKTIVLANKERC